MTEVNVKDLYEMFREDPDFSGGLGGNPNESKEKAAWDEAQSRFQQHKNNEKALKVGINQNKANEAKTARKKLMGKKLLGKQQNPFAIATAKAKEMGYSDFSENSEGDKKRGEIAEAIKKQKINTVSKKVTKSIKDKETTEMNTETVVNGVLKDLVSKGIIKGYGVQKQMSIPAVAGLLGAGAMLAKVFKLEDDDDDEIIAKQVTDFMGNNQDFFENVAQMCEYICSIKEGEEPCDESRGSRILDVASAFHKACPGVSGGGGVSTSISAPLPGGGGTLSNI